MRKHLAIFCSFILFCGIKSENTNIKLGLILPITPGDTETTSGKAWVTIALLAAQTINNSSFIPGYNLDFLVLDTLDSATGTVMAAFTCATQNCIGVVGAAYSQYSELVQYVLQNYSIPQISPVSSTSELSDKIHFPTFMRTIPSDYEEGQAIAQVINHFQWKVVGLIVGSDTYSNSLYSSFSSAAAKFQIKLVVQTFLETIQPDFVGHITELKQAYIQVFVIIAQQVEAEQILQEGYRQGIVGPGFVWIGGDTLSVLNNFTQGVLMGNLVVAPSSVTNSSLANQFLQQISNTNLLNVPYAGFVYDAVYTYANAFRTMVLEDISWSDPHVLLSTLKATNFSGVSGDVAFYPDGDRIPYSFDILCWQADGSLQAVATFDANGQFTHSQPIIWSDNTTNIPPDYLFLIQFSPTERVEIIYTVLASMLLAGVGALFLLILFSLFFRTPRAILVTREIVGVNVINAVGGIVGCAAVLLIVSGVSAPHCVIAPALMDLSLLICGGVLTFSTLHEFVEEYTQNTKESWVSPFVAKVVLYSLCAIIIALNLAGLAGSFAFEAPTISLFKLDKNFYENHCNFALHAVFILPITIGVLFIYAVLANVMKLFLNRGVATNFLRTRRIEILNSILHTATMIVLVICAVLLAVTTPTQTQIDISMCTIIIVANLSVPCNLAIWFTTKPKRASIRLSEPPKKQEPLDSNTFGLDHANVSLSHIPSASGISVNNEDATPILQEVSLNEPFLFSRGAPNVISFDSGELNK